MDELVPAPREDGEAVPQRRPHELTEAELRERPIFEYHEHSEGEGTVVATDLLELGDEDRGVYLVATEFTLANRSVHIGYCAPRQAAVLDRVQPVVIVEGKHVGLWVARVQPRVEIERRWRHIGWHVDQVFPIRYRCLVPVDGAELGGLIDVRSFDD